MQCQKCGAEIDSNARICKNCGTVNLESSEVKQLLGNTILTNKTNNVNYTIDMSSSKDDADKLDIKSSALGSMSTSEKVMWIFNIILHLAIIIGYYFLNTKLSTYINNYNVQNIAAKINYNLNFTYIIPSVIFSFFISTAIQKLIMKSHKHWWGYFIPIYNIYLIFRLGFDSPGVTLLLFICLPILGVFLSKTIPVIYGIYSLIVLIIYIIAMLVYYWKLGRNFGGSGILSLLFPIVMIFIFAYSSKYQYFGSDDKIY